MNALPALTDDTDADAGVIEATGRPIRTVWGALVEVALAVALLVGAWRVTLSDIAAGDDAMRPVVVPDQQVLVSRLTYLFSPPQRGDIVAVDIPTNPGRSAARRLIGLPGEKVEVRGTQVFVNGQPLSEPYLPGPVIGAAQPLSVSLEMTLKADQYFVLSDNRAFFVDSRVWGPVPGDAIIGRAWLTYWPADRIGFIRR